MFNVFLLKLRHLDNGLNNRWTQTFDRYCILCRLPQLRYRLLGHLPYIFKVQKKKYDSLRDSSTVAGWKLFASFEIFLSRKQHFYEMWPKAFILHILKSMMNKSKEIRIRFLKYWNNVSLKSKYIFLTKKWSKTCHKSDNFYDFKKPLRISLENLITKKCANIQVDWMRIA